MPIQTIFTFHIKGVHDCLRRYNNAVANLNFRSFQLHIRTRNRYHDLLPQFIYREQGRYRLSPTMPPGSVAGLGFIGWLPYFNKRWPLAIDKLAFKDFCMANGVPTPRYWIEPAHANNFIVKQRLSSFGYGIRGPYKKLEPADPQSRLASDEFCEEFIPGTMAKAWYWNDRLVCLEMLPMPTVTGDGRQSFSQLVHGKFSPHEAASAHRREIEPLARFHDVAPDDVVPAGTTMLADFRYGSAQLFVRAQDNMNAISKYENTEVGRQFAAAGPVLWQAIPADRRPLTLFTLDAVVDRQDRVWFLEMNCNPAVHPDAYPQMFESLFGPGEDVAPHEAPQLLPATGPSSGPLPTWNMPPNAVVPAVVQAGVLPPYPPGVSSPAPHPADTPGSIPVQR